MSLRISTRSMRFRIISVVSAIVLLLYALLAVSNLYAIHIIRKQAYETYSNTLRISLNGYERGFRDAETFLTSMALESADLLRIATHDEQAWSIAAVREKRRLTQAIPSQSAIDGLFIYEPNHGMWIDATQVQYGNDHRLRLRDALVPLLESRQLYKPSNAGRWVALDTGSEFALVRVVDINGCHVGAWVDTRHLTSPLLDSGYADLGYVFFSDREGHPLDHELAGRNLRLDISGATEHYRLAGSKNRWMLITQSSADSTLYLAALLSDNTILHGLDNLFPLLTLLILGSCLSIILLVLSMRRYLIQPLNKLTNAMRSLKGGDWKKAQIAEHRTYDEFVEVNAAFNQMVDEIETLKISVYERELQQKSAQMQLLKQQLAPHTFVNCLNTIHGLASTGETQLIQQMAVGLGRHLRYALADREVVPLSMELEHVRNYAELSAIRFPNGIRLVEDVEDGVEGAMVPPLLLQTFVENTVKHEVVPGRETLVHLRIRRGASGTLRVQAWDTGDGYSVDTLDRLKVPDAKAGESGEGIGLSNLKLRLVLLYGRAETRVEFSNRPGAGAQMELIIPWGTHREGRRDDSNFTGGR